MLYYDCFIIVGFNLLDIIKDLQKDKKNKEFESELKLYGKN